MRIGILQNPPELSSYVDEMLQSWGLALYDFVEVGELDELDPAVTPALICPARDTDERITAALLNYVRRGGTPSSVSCPRENWPSAPSNVL